MNSGYKTKAELIAWRRNKVIELKAQGRSQEEIAQILQVAATITVDLQYLAQDAKQNIAEYTLKRLPLRVRMTIAGLEAASKEAWNISQTATDNKEKLQALVTFLNINKNILYVMAEAGPYVTGMFNQMANEMTPEQLQAIKEQEREV